MVVSKKVGDFEIIREGGEEVLKVDANRWLYSPNIEGNPLVMLRIVDYLVEVPSISRIILNQKRNFNYSREQTRMLVEISRLYRDLTKQKKLLSLSQLGYGGDVASKYATIQYVIYNLLRSDPIGAYVELVRIIREANIRIEAMKGDERIEDEKRYVDVLEYIKENLEKTQLIKSVKNRLAGHRIGDRVLYAELFRPVVSPDFMYTQLMGAIPLDAEFVDGYSVFDNTISILKLKDDIKFMYHVVPSELKVSEDEYDLIDLARTVLAEHRPREEEFLEPERMRRTFFNIGRDLLLELAEHKGYDFDLRKIRRLAKILVRYTIGFGMIEILLQDPRVQDITVNSPVGQSPVYIVHAQYGECVTNIIPSVEDSEGWATKFRLLSARPLDEANPILDTELEIPGARARVAVITNPLNPYGLAFSLRRHREKPWTLPLFINNKMINPLGAGLISFLIDGARTLLVAGTRSSGKTSLLGSMMVEIMRKYRIICVEDTIELPSNALRKLGYNIQNMKVRSALTTGGTEVAADEGIRTSLRLGDSSLIVGEVRSSIRGSEKVVIVDNGKVKRIPIAELENKDIKNLYVPTLGLDLKINLSKLTGFVKHPKRKILLRVKTRTGREITVTPDHSLFTSHNFMIYPIECRHLKIKSKIVLPARLPCGYNDISYLNLLDIVEDARVINFEDSIKNVISKIGWKKATELCGIESGDIYNYYRKTQKTNIPIKSFNNLMSFVSIEPNLDTLRIKNGTSNTLRALFPVNEDFCRFLGYFISEGYYSKSVISISNDNENIISDVVSLCEKLFNTKPYIRKTKCLGYSTQIIISNSPLVKLIKKLNCGRTSKIKKIPSLIFGLSESKIYSFLSGLYAGDGSFTSLNSSGNAIRYFTTSFELADDLMYLLLHVGIVARLLRKKRNGLSNSTIYVVEFKNRDFVQKFLDNVDFIKYKPKMFKKWFDHSNLNTVSYDAKELEKYLKLIRKYRHLRRFNSCNKKYLKKITMDEKTKANYLIKTYADGEFYLDEVKEIEEINLEEGEQVYDLSVEPMQNFIGGVGGILLHNTEAKALYEAMRIGALANVVAGTIHGDSAYGVFDRVVNDLGVQRTSFKATDIIIIANPVKSADGLHSFRRVRSITEVRKHWENDPLKEQGFVDLMTYNVKKDLLEPTAELINGESETIKMIAGNVREFSGNWDVIWENILLRAKIKEKLVNYANKTKMLDLLEAPFVINSNDEFHRISDKIRNEIGYLDNKRIFFDWDNWIIREIKKRRFG